MTQQEQRPAVEVFEDAYGALVFEEDMMVAARYIEADRAATRAAVVAEIVDWLRVQQHGRTSDNYPGYFANQIAQRFGGCDG